MTRDSDKREYYFALCKNINHYILLNDEAKMLYNDLAKNLLK